MLTKDKDIFLLLKVIGGLTILAIIAFGLLDKWKESRYPFVTFDKELKGKVLKTKPYQSVVYVELYDNTQFRLTGSRNYKYQPYKLNEFLRVGDLIQKEAHSDTIKISRNKKHYVFVLGKDIK